MKRSVQAAVEQAARDNGAVSTSWKIGGKHMLASFHMPDGRALTMPVTKSNSHATEPYKLKGWVRQFINNPSRHTHGKTGE